MIDDSLFEGENLAMTITNPLMYLQHHFTIDL